jgi:hypothetical protein
VLVGGLQLASGRAKCENFSRSCAKRGWSIDNGVSTETGFVGAMERVFRVCDQIVDGLWDAALLVGKRRRLVGDHNL